MKHSFIGSVTQAASIAAALAIPACSSTGDVTELASDGETAAEETPSAASDLDVVDSLEWRGETIDFINTASAGETPDILMVRTGSIGVGDVLYQFQRQADHEVSAAELWQAVTGRQDVPEKLVTNHADVVATTGRPATYQHFNPDLVEKAAFSFFDMFPLTQPNTCWDRVRTFAFQPIIPSIPGYICSSAAAPSFTASTIYHQSQITNSTACSTQLNSKEHIRGGLYNDTDSAHSSGQTAQICFDGGSSGWVCQNIVALPFQAYYMGEYAASSTNHRFAVGEFSSNSSGQGTFADARLTTGVPQFSAPTCTGSPTGR